MRYGRSVLAILALSVCAACGASIQAVYEGDVQFEHCMALDAQPDVKPTIRRACWQEWVAFYTYGQTRDRVRHAQRRVAQLSGATALVEVGPLAGPEPTSAQLAPPSTAQGGDAGPSPLDGGVRPATRRRCQQECEAIRDDCQQECQTHGCYKGCAFQHLDCVADCGSEGR